MEDGKRVWWRMKSEITLIEYKEEVIEVNEWSYLVSINDICMNVYVEKIVVHIKEMCTRLYIYT